MGCLFVKNFTDGQFNLCQNWRTLTGERVRLRGGGPVQPLYQAGGAGEGAGQRRGRGRVRDQESVPAGGRGGEEGEPVVTSAVKRSIGFK